ncbi:hypothetical protein GmHk_19G054331 [Glycine max]|nr:hypothetical protein GmHk_19G054331 [Glycine max]
MAKSQLAWVNCRGLSKGFQGSALKDIERIEREEEERRENEAEALLNHDRDRPLHCSLFSVLRVAVD